MQAGASDSSHPSLLTVRATAALPPHSSVVRGSSPLDTRRTLPETYNSAQGIKEGNATSHACPRGTPGGTSFGSVEVSGTALAASPKLHITLGSQWTEYVVVGHCQVLTFGDKETGVNRFASDMLGNAGTYSGGGKRVSATVTTGGDVGVTFKGKWVKSVGVERADLWRRGNGRRGTAAGKSRSSELGRLLGHRMR